MSPKKPHPVQAVIKDAGVLRFRPNAIVQALLTRSGFTIDQLEASVWPDDQMQLAQLLGGAVDDPRFDAIRVDLPQAIVLKKSGYQPHPMQPVALDDRDVLRFRQNTLVRALLDRDTQRGRIYPEFPARSDGGLNWIAMQDFSQEDQEQFAQLIGYSISGYHELSYVSDASAAEASALAHAINPKAGGCRDAGCPFHGGPIKRGPAKAKKRSRR